MTIMPREKKIFTIHNEDARNISDIFNDEIIDVTITSPPYFDMKDYGNKNQIGYGQTYQEYLDELKGIFLQIYERTKTNGTLWVIIDTLNRNGQVIPLPFDFSAKIQECGWKFKEIIIWEKDKTVPWTHKGQMRNSFEYILLFSKSDNFNFFIDKIRNYESLKPWWIRYPERYNPKGKTPEAIWHFPIPTQGSWGDGYIRHFCPLPEELIGRIITLTTEENDVVFDPFSGSGAVLAKANSMNRRYIGTELNVEYIKMFTEYLHKTHTQKKNEYKNAKEFLSDQAVFEKLILNLRALKYGRIIFQKVREKFEKAIQNVRIEIDPAPPQKKNSLITVNFTFLLTSQQYNDAEILDFLSPILSKPPLSKFGVVPQVLFQNDPKEFISSVEKLFTYSVKNTNQFQNEIDWRSTEMLKAFPIVSSICVNINESIYE